MRRGTLLVLVVLVAVLGALWRTRQARRERLPGLHVYDHALFESIRPERVVGLRIDNLERGVQIHLERDARGSWFLTDPVAYPAVDALANKLLGHLVDARGLLDRLVDPVQADLDPPRVVVEAVQLEEDGRRVRLRVEVGAVDLDGQRVYVRVPGHPAADGEAQAAILRVPRSLANTLDRNPGDFRDRRATHLRGHAVVGLRRRGVVRLADRDEPADLGFAAVIDGTGWKRTDGPAVTLDPGSLGLLLRGAAELQVDDFIDDSPEDLARYGLDPPAFEIELEGERGDITVLRFGIPPVDADVPFDRIRWTAMRAGHDHVWAVAARDMKLLMRPAEAFWDERAVRALREDVVRLELERGGEQLALSRVEDGWSVQLDGGTPQPADEGRVVDLVAALEGAAVGTYLPGTDFVQEDGLGFALETRDGARWGGRLGSPARDPRSGAEGRLFLRFGDQLAGLVSEDLVRVCRTPLVELRRRQVHRFDEREVTALRLESDGRARAWVRRDTRWYPEGVELPAPLELGALIDRLISLRVEAWLDPPPAEGEPLEPEIEVRLRGSFGPERRFILGTSADGEPLCRLPEGPVGIVRPELVQEALRALAP